MNLEAVLSQNRRKTAIARTDYSRPIRIALADGVIDPTSTVFDYSPKRRSNPDGAGPRWTRTTEHHHVRSPEDLRRNPAQQLRRRHPCTEK